VAPNQLASAQADELDCGEWPYYDELVDNEDPDDADIPDEEFEEIQWDDSQDVDSEDVDGCFAQTDQGEGGGDGADGWTVARPAGGEATRGGHRAVAQDPPAAPVPYAGIQLQLTNYDPQDKVYLIRQEKRGPDGSIEQTTKRVEILGTRKTLGGQPASKTVFISAGPVDITTLNPTPVDPRASRPRVGVTTRNLNDWGYPRGGTPGAGTMQPLRPRSLGTVGAGGPGGMRYGQGSILGPIGGAGGGYR
jgi:hypothetical protein